MALAIGENIRKLRNQKDITQEQLAEYLGVTAQAISRWESGNGYPDIETLPALAAYFRVTIEYLMGVDLTQQEQDDLALEIIQLVQTGNFQEAITKGRLGAQKFPANYSIIFAYVSAITVYAGPKDSPISSNEKNVLIEEGLLLLRRIINSNDDTMMIQAKLMSCTLLGSVKRFDEAAQIAGSMPSINCSQEFVLPRYLQKEHKESYILKILPYTLINISSLFFNLEYAYSDNNPPAFYEYNYEECERLLALWNAGYGNKPKNIEYKRGQIVYLLLQVLQVKYSSEADDFDKSINYLQEMLESAAAVCRNKETLLADWNTNSIFKGLLYLDKDISIEGEDFQMHNIAYIIYYGYYKNGYFKALEANSIAFELFEKLKTYAD